MVVHDLYEFFWNEFCDWYIELSRVSLSSDQSPKPMFARRTERALTLGRMPASMGWVP